MRENQYVNLPDYSYRDFVVTVTNSTELILPSNGRRIVVWFSLSSTVNEVWLRPGHANSVDEGFALYSSSPPIRFSFADDGILPMLEWWAIGNAVAEELYVLEILYNPLSRKRREER